MEIEECFKEVYPDKDILYALRVDTIFCIPAADFAKKRADYANAKVYSYMLSVEIPYLGGVNPWHCAEIPFVFRNVDLEPAHCTGYEYTDKLTEEISSAWVAFARTGVLGTDALAWEAYDNINRKRMQFDRTSRMIEEKDQKLLSLIMNQLSNG